MHSKGYTLKQLKHAKSGRNCYPVVLLLQPSLPRTGFSRTEPKSQDMRFFVTFCFALRRRNSGCIASSFTDPFWGPIFGTKTKLQMVPSLKVSNQAKRVDF